MRAITAIVAAFLLTWSGFAHATSLAQERARYLRALTYLSAGRYHQFARLYAAERGYILRPYLRYHELMRRLSHDTPAAVARFLDRERTLPVAGQLRVAWLESLARHHRYKTFRAFYLPSLHGDVSLYCDELKARALAHRPVMPAFQALWVSGNSLPESCRPLARTFRAQGLVTPALAWLRVRHAMRAQNSALVARLTADLAPAQRVWAHRWLAMQAHPYASLRHIDYPLTAHRAHRIVRAGIVALAQQNPVLAMTVWQGLLARHPTLQREQAYVLRHVALLAAYDHLPQALSWLSQVTPRSSYGSVRRWQIRAALRERAWPQVLVFINDLPAPVRHKKEWRYWRARALAKTGHPHAAVRLLTALSRHMTYYGFLAADRLGVPYNLKNVPLAASARRINRLADEPAIEAAHELYVLHQNDEVWAQWWSGLRGASAKDMEAAAQLAARWGWHASAILTLAGTAATHALDLRFPLAYRHLIIADARMDAIDPAWVYGIIRQESAFMLNARSCVGALGLMQLMPQTGFVTAREIHLSIEGDRDLIEATNNVDIGAHYLSDVLSRELRQEPVATAAYNAGPTAVAQWLPVRRALPADLWVDTIPFQQTRDYVKDVMAFTAIYQYLLTGQTNALQTRMALVPPTVELAANEG
ncbi:MAG: transglycosylase SLT domain-containing protein [Gammaproteobacteria bacterium]|nr:transglycosylase SLT domain-containing protein [Gammaproteobacteria bacterium]